MKLILLEYFYLDETVACILIFFRSILNECSTGLCILTTSFIRYYLVCHPTGVFLTEQKLRMISLIMVLLIIAALTWTALTIKFNFFLLRTDERISQDLELSQSSLTRSVSYSFSFACLNYTNRNVARAGM